MAAKGYHLSRDGVERTGQVVDSLLNKIEDLENATHYKSGIMSATDKAKLDNAVADDELTIQEINNLLNF